MSSGTESTIQPLIYNTVDQLAARLLNSLFWPNKTVLHSNPPGPCVCSLAWKLGMLSFLFRPLTSSASPIGEGSQGPRVLQVMLLMSARRLSSRDQCSELWVREPAAPAWPTAALHAPQPCWHQHCWDFLGDKGPMGVDVSIITCYPSHTSTWATVYHYTCYSGFHMFRSSNTGVISVASLAQVCYRWI